MTIAAGGVKVILNGQEYTLSYNSSSGKYEGTVTAPTITSYNVNANHYYPVTVKATNTAGTTTTKDDTDSALGNSLKLTVKEQTPPTITITSPTTGAKLISATPSIAFQLREETNGSGIKISTLQLKIDGGTTITNVSTGMTTTQVTNGYDCTYAVPAGSALTDGAHTVTITIQDNDGNTSTTASTNFTVDTIAPTLNISSPSDNLVTSNASLTVSGTTSDVTSGPPVITISLNGTDQGAVTLNAGSFTKTIALVSGNNTIVIRATDTSGKYTEITRTVTLDTSAPVISAITITPNPANAGATLTISVTVSG